MHNLIQKLRRRIPVPNQTITPEDEAFIRDLSALAHGDLHSFEPKRMDDDQLVRAAWGYLRVEESDLTIEETRRALSCLA